MMSPLPVSAYFDKYITFGEAVIYFLFLRFSPPRSLNNHLGAPEKPLLFGESGGLEDYNDAVA